MDQIEVYFDEDFPDGGKWCVAFESEGFKSSHYFDTEAEAWMFVSSHASSEFRRCLIEVPSSDHPAWMLEGVQGATGGVGDIGTDDHDGDYIEGYDSLGFPIYRAKSDPSEI